MNKLIILLVILTYGVVNALIISKNINKRKYKFKWKNARPNLNVFLFENILLLNERINRVEIRNNEIIVKVDVRILARGKSRDETAAATIQVNVNLSIWTSLNILVKLGNPAISYSFPYFRRINQKWGIWPIKKKKATTKIR